MFIHMSIQKCTCMSVHMPTHESHPRPPTFDDYWERRYGRSLTVAAEVEYWRMGIDGAARLYLDGSLVHYMSEQSVQVCRRC